MRIGVDVSDLCTNRADGTTRYTKELAKRLPELGSQQEWHYFAPSRLPARQAGGENIQWHASPWPKFWTQARLPVDLWRYPVDRLFMPIQQLPIFRPRKTKTVAVIHDLACHEFGEQYGYKDWLLLQTFSAQVAREADDIICVSRATANDVEKYYGRTKEVRVIYHGVDQEKFVGSGDKYPDLHKPYILFVGQIQPRKNLARLMEAFEILAGANKDLQLVIAGGHGWLQEPILNKAKKSGVANRIKLLGRVPDEKLPALYANAEVFVLPSLQEGFGMPILEAFACGTPVVTSNVSCMPEIAGGAAVLVDPHEVESIAAGIEEAMDNRGSLIEKGKKRAGEFSWEKTARETLEVLTK